MNLELSTRANTRSVTSTAGRRKGVSKKAIDLFISSNGAFKVSGAIMNKYGLDIQHELNYSIKDGKVFLIVVKEGVGVSLTNNGKGDKKSQQFTSNVLRGFLEEAGLYTHEVESKEKTKKDGTVVLVETVVRKNFNLTEVEIETGNENIVSVLEISVKTDESVDAPAESVDAQSGTEPVAQSGTEQEVEETSDEDSTSDFDDED